MAGLEALPPSQATTSAEQATLATASLRPGKKATQAVLVESLLAASRRRPRKLAELGPRLFTDLQRTRSSALPPGQAEAAERCAASPLRYRYRGGQVIKGC